MGQRDNIKLKIRRNIRILLFILLIVSSIIIFSLANPVFMSLATVMNIVRRIGVLSIVSIGMTLVMLTGGIDLSVGANLAISGSCAAIVLNRTWNPFLAIIVAIIVATLIGSFNGFMIGKLKVNSIVLTLAVMSIGKSLNLVVLSERAVRVDNSVFSFFGSDISAFGVDIPIVLFIIIVFYLFFYFVLERSILGRRLTAIGSNYDASKVAGISAENNIVLVYIIMGVIIGITSIINIGRSSSASPLAGINLEFQALTAVIIGGTLLTGGKAYIEGTFLGVVFLGILYYGLSLLNIPVYYIQTIQGVMLLFAITVYSVINRLQSRY